MLIGTLLYAERENTGDAVFVIDSKRICAHRNVLAAFSPKYKAQFYGAQPDEGDIHVKGISAEAFEEFIKFFYGQTVNYTMQNVENILSQAKQCLINVLVQECELFLANSLKEENLLWNYGVAILYDLETLTKICEDRIMKSVPKIFTTNEFLACEQHVLMRILTIEPFADCKESSLFESCIEWARATCRRKNINDKNPRNLRTQLNRVLDCIYFGSFNIHKFVELNEAYKGFFTADEFIEITKIIGDLKNFRSKKFNGRARKRSAVDGNASQQQSPNSSGNSSGSSPPGPKCQKYYRRLGISQ